MCTLGLIPLAYRSEWIVQCNVLVRAPDGSELARYPLLETGTFHVRAYPPTCMSLFGVSTEGPRYLREVQAKTANSLALQIVDAVNADYAKLAAARDATAGSAPAAPRVAMPPPPQRQETELPAPVAKRWAVVVGIADYAHRGKWDLTNLRYAARDATALASVLRDDRAGRFDDVQLLLDGEATTRNVRIALREKLRGVQDRDTVLVFWAGHGCPDPGEPSTYYLVTHDTDPEHMAATGYAMSDLKQDIGRLAACNVVLIADTCHSGGLSDPAVGVRGAKENRIIDQFRAVQPVPDRETETAGRIQPTRLTFTSCESGETSLENSELGGGHGVFTWFLLNAVKGEGDALRSGGNNDGRVSLGEMVDFTRDQVKRFTGNRQHPDVAGRFARDLVLAGDGR